MLEITYLKNRNSHILMKILNNLPTMKVSKCHFKSATQNQVIASGYRNISIRSCGKCAYVHVCMCE